MVRLYRFLAALAAAFIVSAATTPSPAGFSNVKVISRTVNVTRPPASPVVTLDMTGGKGTVVLTWAGPSGEPFIQSFYGDLEQMGRLQGTATMTTPGYYNPFVTAQLYNAYATFNLYTEPGTWTLTGVEVCNSESCASTQNTNFGTVAVINPDTPDFTPPVIVSGTIRTPTISLSSSSRLASMTIKLTDDVSGIRNVSAVAEDSKGHLIICNNLNQPQEVTLSTQMDISTALSKKSATGTYTVTKVIGVDVAGNRSTVSDPGAISTLFGGATTIVVTK